jgi:5-methylcytosine-specific restriction endonuclease McrA
VGKPTRRDLSSIEYRWARAKLRAESNQTNTVCALCGLPIDYDAPRYDPLAFSVDHIIPWSLGGTHDLIQATHVKCNSAKRNKLGHMRSRASRNW